MKQITVNVKTGAQTEVPFTAEEIAAQETFVRDTLPAQQMAGIRAKRNKLLADTDYLALPDVTMSADMQLYRQALRDLPANVNPASPTWPVKPS